MIKSRTRGARRWQVLVATEVLVVVVVFVAFMVIATPTRAQDGQWMRQFGSAGHDSATGAAADASGVVVVGWTSDAMAGQSFAGGPRDAFVRRYDATGVVVWTSEFGTSGADAATAVASAGNAATYVAGQVGGPLAGAATSSFDAFVRRYDAEGGVVWTRQFGAGPASTTSVASIAVDATGAVYVAGWVFGALPGAATAGADDAYVRKYDASGNDVWTQQFGGADHDLATAVVVDAAGGVYVAGQSDRRPGDGGTTFVRKFRPGGELLWTRSIGEPSDATLAVAVDPAGAAYLVGEAFPPEQTHNHAKGTAMTNHRGVPFVSRYAPDGAVAWTRQFGAGATDTVVKLAVDSTGTVYVVGHKSRGKEAGAPDFRSIAFVRSFDATGGAPGVSRQFPSAGYTRETAVAVGPRGELYTVGWTRGALPGSTANGPTDAFVAKVRL
jgi:beta-propeller repeat-containing protein